MSVERFVGKYTFYFVCHQNYFKKKLTKLHSSSSRATSFISKGCLLHHQEQPPSIRKKAAGEYQEGSLTKKKTVRLVIILPFCLVVLNYLVSLPAKRIIW